MATNVGFKLGSQATANAMLLSPSDYNITEGSFYLTSDTHRLYIGALPTSTNKATGEVTFTDTTPQLYPLNEGIETCTRLQDLPIFTAGTSEEQAAIGRFYYVENENILCIYGGTKNGNGWIQVNTNTDTTIKSTAYAITKQGNDTAEVSYSLKDSDGKDITSTFSLKVDKGLLLDVTGSEIKISGDKYNLGLEAVSDTSPDFKITLESENTDNDSEVIISPGTGINLQKGANGELKISTEEAGALKTLTVENGYVSTSADKEGFRVVATNQQNKTFEGGFNPQIKYGKVTFDTVSFKDGLAELDVYTSDEIEVLLRTLNAMRYRGTVGVGGTVASEITYDGTGYNLMDAAGNRVQVSVGDTFICKTMVTVMGSVPTGDKGSYTAGTILIAEGVEGNDGYITPGTLKLEYVESSNVTDTTYTLARNSSGNGVVLRAADSGEYGEIQIIGSDKISASTDTQEVIQGKPVTKITLTHKAVARTDTTDQTASEQASGQIFTIPTIKDIETDDEGHITSVTVRNYTVRDTITSISKVDGTTKAYTKDGVSVGAITFDVYARTDMNAESNAMDSVTLVSETLEIKTDDNYSATASGTAKEHGLSINMVWGEF